MTDFLLPPPEDIPESLRAQVDALLEQALTAHLNQLPECADLCQKALNLAAPDGWQRPLYPAGAAMALQTLGRTSLAHYNFPQAFESLQRALTLFERMHNQREAANTRAHIANTRSTLGDYAQAAEMLRQVLSESEALHDELLEAETLNDLSYTYIEAGDPQMALQCVQRSIAYFRASGDEMRLAWALDTLGRAYHMVGRTTEAAACLEEGLEIARKRPEAWSDILTYLNSVALIYIELGDRERARDAFTEQLELARAFQSPGEECRALTSLARLHLEEEHPQLAYPLLKQALEIAEATGLKPHLRECCQLMAEACKQSGDYRCALEFHQRFHELDRAIFNAETDQRLKNLQVIYQVETAKKEAELYQVRAQTLQIEVEERKRSEAALAEIARTDPLTGILNRRAFFDAAEEHFRQARALGQPLGIILIDIDYFKQVNDRYGHQTGDQALVSITACLRSELRSGDLIGRYGGEEFIVLLPKAGLRQAASTADRLRRTICLKPLHARGHSMRITLSLGAAAYDPNHPVESLDELIGQADQALYCAKEKGRNSAVAFPSAECVTENSQR